MGQPEQVAPPPWRPEPGTAWQWQLSGDLDLTVDVPVYDVDWQVPRAVVDRLHADGRRVIGYVSAGTWEAYRDDAGDFPPQVLGAPMADWPDERWLDVRRLDLLAAPLLRRLDACRDRGFDAVEPDNVDGWANATGFDLTAADQLRFNRWIAAEVHARGMAVGLKNDLGQVRDLVDDVDFAVNESCARYAECHLLDPFVAAGKAVLHVEYGVDPAGFCAAAHRPGFSSMLKRRDLDAWRHVCEHG
ncbi:endo alpha-1,4 polygalactosaminidase [Kineococcus glutinatus]|uniref:Endo alpha-1,4 polygalactosaminidase n=1 Tax=Kineococcus glutinatus TaxID=1070872 RepID=A0ABP9IC71_9ACTN